MSKRKRLKRIKKLVSEWIDKQGHDQCWYYPEIFRAICAELDVDSGQVPTIDRKEFCNGCSRYQDELFGPELIQQILPFEILPFAKYQPVLRDGDIFRFGVTVRHS